MCSYLNQIIYIHTIRPMTKCTPTMIILHFVISYAAGHESDSCKWRCSVLTLYFADELRKSTTSHGLRYILQNIHQVAIFALKCRPLLNFDVFPLITLTVSFNTCDNFFTKYELSMITVRCYA